MRLNLLAGACALALLAGCNQEDPNLAKETSENPYFAEAAQNLQANNYVEAVKSYEAALQANPDVAQAHYEIARIYSDRLNDPVSAIYHYDRYLELRPEAENRAQVEQFREDAKLAFAASNAKDAVELQQNIARLQNENQLLKDEVAKLKSQLEDAMSSTASATTEVAVVETDTTETTGTSDESSPEESAPADPSQPSVRAAVTEEVNTPAEASGEGETVSKPAQAARTYIIQSGDSLWKIAKKSYPDAPDINETIKKIKEANPETLANDRNLKIGTEIVLP